MDVGGLLVIKKGGSPNEEYKNKTSFNETGFALRRLMGVGLGSETVSKSLGNSKMTDPIKDQFNGYYRRLIKISNYPYKYQAIHSLSVSLRLAKEEKKSVKFCFGRFLVLFFQQ